MVSFFTDRLVAMRLAVVISALLAGCTTFPEHTADAFVESGDDSGPVTSKDADKDDVSSPSDVVSRAKTDTSAPSDVQAPADTADTADTADAAPPQCNTPSDCDPAKKCQTIECVAGKCVYGKMEDGSACDDKSHCVTDAKCKEGKCIGVATVCDDGDGCTVDSCDIATGCVQTASKMGCAHACENDSGKAKCVCDTGYHLVAPKDCVDTDECKTNNDGCHKDATCKNSVGSYDCTCKQGYAGDGKTNCADQCTINNGDCHKDADCSNMAGAISCLCKSGFTGNGQTCTPKPSCKTNNGGCDKNATCTTGAANAIVCACNKGWEPDGKACKDVNECNKDNGGCAVDAICVNGPGTHKCTCKAGYELDSKKKSCLDVDECKSNNGGCHTEATCKNNPGSFSCTCKSGYTGNGLSCTKSGSSDKPLNTAASAKESRLAITKVIKMPNTYQAGVYWIDPDGAGKPQAAYKVYCLNSTKNEGSGWTLVMKVRGDDADFAAKFVDGGAYKEADYSYWDAPRNHSKYAVKNADSVNLDDSKSAKFLSYYDVQFKEIMLVFRTKVGGKVEEHGTVLSHDSVTSCDKQDNDALYDNFHCGNTLSFKNSKMTKDAWEKLVPGSKLQSKLCGQGLNVPTGGPNFWRVRIGVVADDDCNWAESWLGVGGRHEKPYGCYDVNGNKLLDIHAGSVACKHKGNMNAPVYAVSSNVFIYVR